MRSDFVTKVQFLQGQLNPTPHLAVHGEGDQGFQFELVLLHEIPVACLGCVPNSNRPLWPKMVQSLDDAVGTQEQSKVGEMGGAEKDAEIRTIAQLAHDVLVLDGVVTAVFGTDEIWLVCQFHQCSGVDVGEGSPRIVVGQNWQADIPRHLAVKAHELGTAELAVVRGQHRETVGSQLLSPVGFVDHEPCGGVGDTGHDGHPAGNLVNHDANSSLLFHVRQQVECPHRTIDENSMHASI